MWPLTTSVLFTSIMNSSIARVKDAKWLTGLPESNYICYADRSTRYRRKGDFNDEQWFSGQG